MTSIVAERTSGKNNEIASRGGDKGEIIMEDNREDTDYKSDTKATTRVREHAFSRV